MSRNDLRGACRRGSTLDYVNLSGCHPYAPGPRHAYQDTPALPDRGRAEPLEQLVGDRSRRSPPLVRPCVERAGPDRSATYRHRQAAALTGSTITRDGRAALMLSHNRGQDPPASIAGGWTSREKMSAASLAQVSRGRRRGGSDRQHRFSGQRIRAVWLPDDHGPADGWRVNHKRVERIWRREGLKVPAKHPKRGRLWLNDGSCIRLRPAYATTCGRTTWYLIGPGMGSP